jgi:hypothetical protein
VEVCFKSEIGSKEKYFTAIEICEFSVTTGVRAKEPRDYSVVGTKTEQAFNAIGALATIAFAFNTGILPEVQVHTSHMYPSVRLFFSFFKNNLHGQPICILNC